MDANGSADVIEDTKMNAENNDDDKNESSSQSEQGSEQTPTSKLRDLRPEKDPMGGEMSPLRTPMPALPRTEP